MTTHIQTIYTEDKTPFADTVNSWLEGLGFHVLPFQENDELTEKIDAVVFFYPKHKIYKTTAELTELF